VPGNGSFAYRLRKRRRDDQDRQCGIAGRVLRQPGAIGADLVAMLTAQRHRGTDSTGFALYGEPLAAGFV
jgi:glutamate synthase domain-containing protein 1